MRHQWVGDPARGEGWYRCPYCGLRRLGDGAAHSRTYLTPDGEGLRSPTDCTRRPLDCSPRAAHPLKRIAPFLRSDHKGDAARAALPKRPPGRKS